MLSKIVRFAKLPNFQTSSGRSKAIRWFTTENQPPKPTEAAAKSAEAVKPPPAPKASTAQQSTKAADPSKGKYLIKTSSCIN